MVKPVNNNFSIKTQYNGSNPNYQLRFPQNFNYYIGTITKSIVNKQFMRYSLRPQSSLSVAATTTIVIQRRSHIALIVAICAYDIENH